MSTLTEKLYQRLRAFMSDDIVAELEQPDKAEFEAIGRIVAAAWAAVQVGTIAHDDFICSSEVGQELRESVEAYVELKRSRSDDRDH